ncbi:MAG: DEAD/DEAH box helicase [Fibromonadales bacterium]|nr:DEAD/DEAH box helicase [Fibromonadales bacterium]
MAEKFGKTWWGEHFLRSLENVDYDNRLPRGASYAQKGAVKMLKITDNYVSAKVSGSRPSPYRVLIVVPPFSEEETAKLIDEIIKQPALISKLLNRELDPSILTIAENFGLKIFPQKWTDFKMNCSCPDWAVPCKHLAAVLYILSREIDNNPFLVFEMHNVNLLEELEKRGIFVSDSQKTEIPVLKNLWQIKKNIAPFDEKLLANNIDFSDFQNISNTLVQLLPETAPFYYSGNFKEKYSVQLNNISRNVNRILSGKTKFDDITPNLITPRSVFKLAINGNNKLEIIGENHNIKQIEKLIPALFSLNPDRLRDYDCSTEALYKVLLSSLNIIANGMIIPQIVQLEDKKYSIRWLAALIDNRVKTVVNKLSTMLPEDLLQTKRIVRNKERFECIKNQTLELLSLFITSLAFQFSKTSGNDRYEEMFFAGHVYGFDSVGENALTGGIKVWLDRFFLTAETYKPIINISEALNDNFDIQISVEDTTKPDELSMPLKQILTQKQYEKKRFKILQNVSLLAPFIRGLDSYVNTGGISAIRFNKDEFAPFLMEILPVVRLLDIKTILPKSLQEVLHPKVSLKISKSEKGQGFINLQDLFLFDWQIALGSNVISSEEFAKLLKHASHLFKFKGQYFYVNEQELEKIHKALSSDKKLSPLQLLQTALAEEYEGAPVLLTDEVRDLIRELTSESNIPLPSNLNAKLRPYQERGYSWMYRNSSIGFGSIIADDMGLGKTLQVISLLLKYKEEDVLNQKQQALVVVPTGLLTNWKFEIEKFAPTLSIHIFHGQCRELQEFKADIMLTTYGVLRSDFEILKTHKWQILIVDEAQNIKNHETAQTKAVKSIPANIRIAMSGTPVENRLTEFWSIMDYANKGYLGNVKAFKDNFATPIQLFNNEQVAGRFRKITAPFMMRRMKTDKSIISDLPDKIEQDQFALLTKQQAALYEKTMTAAMEQIESCDDNSQSLFKRQGLILQMILALKQICNHPAQFLKDGKKSASYSGKTELLFELLDGIMESNEKVLIFTQFTEMGKLLEHFIAERFGEKPLFYHGSCSIKQREEMVLRFQQSRADKIFILSLKAAGTGLNLTAASHVIHYDLWWNPAVENQATDRAYRIGQKKNVMVHRMICKNTFEERINEMIQKKKHLAEMTVASGENWIGKLSNKELREIFQ